MTNRPIARSLALIAATALLGCGATAPPPEGPPTGAESQPAAPAAVEAAAPQAITPQAPPAVDLAGEVMLTVVVKDLDAALSQGVAYVQPHLPPAFRMMVRPETLKAQLFAALRMPQLAQALDTGRPAALALLDPQRHRGQVGPVLLALPVADEQKLVEQLSKIASRHERTPYGDHLFTSGGETLGLRFDSGYALIAAAKQVGGAAAVLLPLVRSAPKAAAQLRVDLAAVNARYGAQVAREMARLRDRQQRKSVEQAGTLQMIRRWLGYLGSAQELTVKLDLDHTVVRLQGAVTARSSGAFFDHLRRQKAGPAWGARFVPADSGLVYLARQSPAETVRSVDEHWPLFTKALKGVVPSATMTRLRGLLVENARTYSGELASGVWVNADGAVGMGGAARVADAARARATGLKLGQMIVAEVNRVMRKGLPPAVKRDLQGLDLRAKLRPGGLRVAGARADLLELSVTWPRPKERAARKELAEIKKRVTRVLGRKLTLAVVYKGDVALWAAGKDHRKRLAAMLAAAKGGAGSGTEKTVRPLVAGKQVVDHVYMPVATFAEQAMRLADRLTAVPTQVKDMFHKIMPGPGKTVPASATLHVSGRRLLLDAEVSPDLIGMLAKAGMAFFKMRGGLSRPPGQP